MDAIPPQGFQREPEPADACEQVDAGEWRWGRDVLHDQELPQQIIF